MVSNYYSSIVTKKVMGVCVYVCMCVCMCVYACDKSVKRVLEGVDMGGVKREKGTKEHDLITY